MSKRKQEEEFDQEDLFENLEQEMEDALKEEQSEQEEEEEASAESVHQDQASTDQSERIEQERAARQVAEARLAQIEQRLRDFEERSQRQANEQVLRQDKTDEERLKIKLDQIKQKRGKAILEADSDAFNQADDEFRAAYEELQQVRYRAQQAKEKEKEQNQYQQPVQPQIPPQARDWINRQSAWLGKQGFEPETALADSIYSTLQNEGLKPDTQDFYEELNRRLSGTSKRLAFLNPDKGRDVAKTKSMTVGNSRTANTQPSGKKILTEEDKKGMVANGFDPYNPRHRKSWLQRHDPL